MLGGSIAYVTGERGHGSMFVSAACCWVGNPGDVKAVGEGVSELRIDYGPGYRVYYTQRGQRLIVLLAGGDKHTQKQDIKRALEIARDLQEVCHGKN